jgi:glutathione S-transferase
MITVHHLELSRSQRVLWLLEELGLDYQVKGYRRTKRFLAPDELKAVHPLGKSPVLTDGDVTVAESGAILEYLLERYGQGRLKPSGGDALLRFRYWLHYAEGSLMPLVVLRLVLQKMREPPMPLPLRPLAGLFVQVLRRAYLDPAVTLQVGFVESELARSPWFCGDEFSAADIQMYMPLEGARVRVPLTRAEQPHIHAFLQRCSQRPAFQRAQQRGQEALPVR